LLVLTLRQSRRYDRHNVVQSACPSTQHDGMGGSDVNDVINLRLLTRRRWVSILHSGRCTHREIFHGTDWPARFMGFRAGPVRL